MQQSIMALHRLSANSYAFAYSIGGVDAHIGPVGGYEFAERRSQVAVAYRLTSQSASLTAPLKGEPWVVRMLKMKPPAGGSASCGGGFYNGLFLIFAKARGYLGGVGLTLRMTTALWIAS